MVTRQLIDRLEPGQWAELEQVGTPFEWDAAWEAALDAGAGHTAQTAMERARRVGAGPRAAALVAAAIAAASVEDALDPGQLRVLLQPVARFLPGLPVPAPVQARSRQWPLLRRCPAVAAAAALAGVLGR